MSHSLVQALPLSSPQDAFVAYTRQDFSWSGAPNNFSSRTSWQRRLGNRPLGRELDALAGGFDVHFSLAEPPPTRGRFLKCATIADLIPMTHPELIDPSGDGIARAEAAFRTTCDRADMIHCISEHTEREVQERLNVSPDRTFVAHLGLVSREVEPEPLPQIFGRFVLAVSRIDPQKNLVRFIEAFASIPDKDLKLVVAGKAGWRADEVFAAPAAFGVQDRVHFLGHVSDANLVWLYQNASAFVCPSIAEGFGLPVVEAMSFGCPVAASRTGALPELIGDTGVLFDPLEPDSITEGLQEALASKETQHAKERSKQFTFHRTAEEIMKQLRARV